MHGNKGAEADKASTSCMYFIFNHSLTRSCLAPSVVNIHGTSVKPRSYQVQQGHRVLGLPCHGRIGPQASLALHTETRSISARVEMVLVASDRVCFDRGTDHQDGTDPIACNSSGFLLWLFSAVLCPTLRWPRGTCSSTNLHGAADGAYPLTGAGAVVLEETQSNPHQLLSG
jgi:hypothetical protein